MLSFGCKEENELDTFTITPSEIQEKGEFKTSKIFGKTWMAENLNVSHYRNGDSIPHYNWCYYDNDSSNNKYGKLYNLAALMDPRGIAPEGWHVPTLDEYNKLIGVKNSDSIKSLKSCFDWKDLHHFNGSHENTNGTNTSGFNAYPSGYYNYGLDPKSGTGRYSHNDWHFIGKGKEAKWWIYPDEGFYIKYRGNSMVEYKTKRNYNTSKILHLDQSNYIDYLSYEYCDGDYYSIRLIKGPAKSYSDAVFIDNKLTGIRKSYYDNGQIKEDKNYLNGQLNGNITIWSESGKLLYKTKFIKGTGLMKKFLMNGEIHTETNYKNGLKDCAKKVWGHYRDEKGIRHPKHVVVKEEFYDEGKLVDITCFDDKGNRVKCSKELLIVF